MLTFLAIGDFGQASPEMHRLAKAMSTYATETLPTPPSFILGLGDNFYDDGVKSVDDPRFKDTWEDIYLVHEALRVPWHVVLGNHDYMGNPDAQIQFTTHSNNPGGLWHMPDRNYTVSHTLKSKDGSSEPFTVDLFALDTNGTQSSVRRRHPEAHEQLFVYKKQLEEKLKASTADYKIVFGHHPMYTRGNLHMVEAECLRSPEYMSKWGEYFDGYYMEPTFVDNGVTAYFSGHEHVFQHNSAQGVEHFICGASGAEETCFYGGACPYTELSWFDETFDHGFVAVTIDRAQMKVDFVSVDLKVLHTVVVPRVREKQDETESGSEEGEVEQEEY